MEIRSAPHTAQAASEGEILPQFAAVLAQLKHHNIAPLASTIRQSIETIYDESSISNNVAPWHGCSVSNELLNGSFNLAYPILFEDGVEWILKIPANGHHDCFDHSAAEALRTEALTMRLIKQLTTVPIPNIYHFDASSDNDIGCPYILMDFLKGKPLWQGWFDEESSRSSVEQFRARSMQTIAAAMVQLSQFTVDSGSFLQFDRDGQPVGVTTARVPDWLAGLDIQQGLMTAREGCLYCEKGPINDPAASFLFMLDRRGIRKGDGPLELGSYEIVRMFTEWTLEKAENADNRRRKFVLAHPDFAVQNFLVEDDGTLCGIIDWDGVAAVPLSIGCLRYPDWLMSDWHPSYSYCPGVVGQHVNSREDLTTYRTMYAQFVEASSTVVCGSSRAGKFNADITRRSLIAGSLDAGAQDPELTNAMISIIFEKLEHLTADDDEGEMSDTGLGSSIATGTNDVNEEDSGGDTSTTETEDRVRIDEKDDSVDSSCSKASAGLVPQPPPTQVDDESDASRPRISHTTRFDGLSSGPKHELMSPFNGTYLEKKARDQRNSSSRKTRLAKWALSLGKRSSRMLVDSLHKKEVTKRSKPCRKVRAIKWALDLGEKCCKGASERFHKAESPSDLYQKDWQQSLSVQNNFEPISRAVNPAAGICKRIETPQSNFVTRLDPDRLPSSDESETQKTMTKRIQAWVSWFVAIIKRLILKPMIPKPIGDDVIGVQTPAAAGRRLSTNVVLLNEQHWQGCDHPGEDSRLYESQSDGMRSTCIYSQDAWASIAAEVDQGGIPIDLIKKRRDVIVKCVIQSLGNEVQQEQDTSFHTKNEKAAELEQQATVNSTNNESTQDSLHSPAVHGSRRTDFDHKMAALAESFVAPLGATKETVSLNRTQDECEKSKPGLLMSKLEAAERRFDLEPRLKGRQSESPTPGLGKYGGTRGRSQIPEPQETAHDLSTLENIEEANQKLRTILSSLEKLSGPSTKSCSDSIQVMEAHRATIENMGHMEAERFGKDHEMGEPVKQKLRNVLSSLKRPEAVTTDLRKEMIQVAGDVNGYCKSRDQSQMLATKPEINAGSNFVSVHNPYKVLGGQWCETSKGIVAVQTATNVKRGCWFETAGGSLKRTKIQEALHGKANDQEWTSSSQLAISDHQVSKAVNVFQVPNDDDNSSGYDTRGSTDDKNDREDNRPEDGDDTGKFKRDDVCVALGKGNLDEQRMRRLKKGFMALLEAAVGEYGRRV